MSLLRRLCRKPCLVLRLMSAAAPLLFGVPSHAGTPTEELSCGGALEQRTWKLWDSAAKAHIQTVYLEQRLFGAGDTYALYDLQTLLHNLVWMASRCQRIDRLRELASLLQPVFDRLEPLDKEAHTHAWICRGGLVCNDKNRLINQEVRLVSSQGLGLLTTLAATLARSGDMREVDRAFVDIVQSVAAQHVLRWTGPDRLQSVRSGLRSMIKPGSSKATGFSDQAMWQLVILSNLATIDHQMTLRYQAGLSADQRTQLSSALQALAKDFTSRVMSPQVALGHPGTARADFDHDSWRQLPGNRFAGYEESRAPARCLPGNEKPELLVNPDDYPAKRGVGWDISHSRRLVHVTLAFELARDAFPPVYGIKPDTLQASNLAERFANQIVQVLWNGDAEHPLFTNYWSGANGWYRVGYINGTGRCYPGTPPFGLSESFPTGGYVLWADKQPLIKSLGTRLLALTESPSAEDKSFLQRYYPALVSDPKEPRMVLTQLMFWPTLVTPLDDSKQRSKQN